MTLTLVLIAITLIALSGLPGLFLGRFSRWGQWSATGLMGIGALAGLIGAGSALTGRAFKTVAFPWPAMGNSLLGVDALSAFFLIPIFLMGGLGAVYGLGYWPQPRHPRTARKLQLFWGSLVAGMALLVISQHAMAFLIGWEAMALSAFFLVSLEDHRRETRRAGLIYFMATHIGTLALFGSWVYWRWATKTFQLSPLTGPGLELGVMNGLFFLALLTFGLKAGIMPLHFWLPEAHTQAPSHVSGMLSGVVLKMGIYGLLRLLSLLPSPPPLWGGVLLLAGAVSGVLGVVFALGQHDLKRLLAYHSIENIGIILMGLGLAMLGRSFHHPEWVVLGMAGCLLHVWNHSFFKSLLFLCAGAVLHATGTRQIDRLGGLAKTMPWTAFLFLVGAVAICGLPPLNGFISEWLVFLGLLQAGNTPGVSGPVIMVVAPILAMIGALAIACFVKVYGAVFLGMARTTAAPRVHEARLSMRLPMMVLAAICLVIGVVPTLVMPILDAVIAVFSAADGPLPSLTTVAPLSALGTIAIGLLVCLLLLGSLVFLRSRAQRRVITWDCGYAQPTARMQYTASSLAQTLVTLFRWVLRPQGEQPQLPGLFPKATRLESHSNDLVLDRVVVPGFHAVEQRFGWFRRFQQGLTQHYLLYILLTMLLLLSTLLPFEAMLQFLAAR